MGQYYINKDNSKNPNENYEVHLKGCKPWPENDGYLGMFNNCQDAVSAAKNGYPKISLDIDGCSKCCPDCNKENQKIKLLAAGKAAAKIAKTKFVLNPPPGL